MTPANLIQLFALAAIWGASFLFMRIAAPVLGPILLTELRPLFAAGFLALAAMAWRQPLESRKHWRVLPGIGPVQLGAAIPAAVVCRDAPGRLAAVDYQRDGAGLCGSRAAVWLRESMSLRTLRFAGRVSGVAILVGYDEHALQSKLAVAAALAAASCYGIGSVYTRTIVKAPPSLAMAHGSMWAAALLATPLLR